MSFCTSCGKENLEGTRFCVYCGAPIAGAAPKTDYRQPQGASYGGYSAPEYSGGYMSRPAATREQAAVKTSSASKTALFAAIFFSAALLCSIIFSSLLPGIITGRLGSFLNSFDASDVADIVEQYTGEDLDDYISIRELDGYMDQLLNALRMSSGKVTLSQILSSMTSRLVPIALAVGMWICWASARKGTVPGCGTGGITTIKVVEVLRLIGACCATFCFALLPVALGLALSDEVPEASTVAWAALAVVLIIGGIVILYRALLVSAVNRIRTASDALPGKGKIAGFAVFMLWLCGIFSILKGLGCIGSAVLLGGAAVLPMISGITTGLGQICVGKYLSQTRKALAR